MHDHEHIEQVKNGGLYDAAALAAGGAICAAELALSGEPAFALMRPPGHHASANRAWGMCYFNNMAIAIRKIRPGAKRALIIDIDLHFGDGTVSIFRGDGDVKIVNPWSVEENFQYLELDESSYLGQEEDAFQGFDCDIVGVSAGFDTYLEYWGGLLKMEDYRKIGKAVREGAEKVCEGQRFAVLEVLDRLALADDWLVIGKFLVDLHSHNFLGRREFALRAAANRALRAFGQAW